MKIGINSSYEIKEVNNITDTTLVVFEFDETSENYPFKEWSNTRILCYCYKQTEQGVSIYPYIDPKVIEKLEQQAEEQRKLQETIDIMLGVE